MSEFLITSGWILDLASIIWIVLILSERLLAWIPAHTKASPGWYQWLSHAANPPVNLVRRVLPTIYREVDFAPWLTIVLLLLIKTFVFRSMIYWGMLHQPIG